MIKIITGCENTPVIIADTDIENSFDLQGCFIGKLPFDLDTIINSAPVVTRRTLPEQPQQQQSRTQPAAISTRRPPNASVLRSIAAATTTVNSFVI